MIQVCNYQIRIFDASTVHKRVHTLKKILISTKLQSVLPADVLGDYEFFFCFTGLVLHA